MSTIEVPTTSESWRHSSDKYRDKEETNNNIDCFLSSSHFEFVQLKLI